MRHTGQSVFAIILCAAMAVTPCFGQTQSAVPLPAGVKAVWDLTKAYREASPSRERVCINGLWRWQPAEAKADQPPAANWGYFKVPGAWPGITDYLKKDSQNVYAHPTCTEKTFGGVTTAWYQREISVPKEWAGRRIAVSLEYLNSRATVYVDGQKAGDIFFPGGEADITSVCQPGSKQLLSLRVAALPLRDVMLVVNNSNAPRSMRGRVDRRGLCGDAYLVGMPAGPRIEDVKVDTSVRKGEITLSAAPVGLAPTARYMLRATISDKGRQLAQFTSKAFTSADLDEGRAAVTGKWKPEKLWDTHTPQNTLEASLSLLEDESKELDTALPVRFGFREFWIDGRDFYLNGTRIFLSALPLDNAEVSAVTVTYDAAKESMLRLRGMGINCVYTHNYGCEPGTHLGFAEILRAADDVGMLISFSQPHYGQYDWKSPDADQKNGYAQHAAFYVRMAQNHPSVVFYSMNHNATGYVDDMNPDLIDGLTDPRRPWAKSGTDLALRAQAVVHRLDPSRVIYHHSSGNLGAMHTSNFYPNWVPVQEMSDWFEHWSTKGVKPLFTCEYAASGNTDWGLFRGWYKGKRDFGSALQPWEFCLAEWNSQFLGDEAYKISEAEKRNLRWEAKQFQAGKLWHRWDYPSAFDSPVLTERFPIFAKYVADNWRSFRTWEMSANDPWEYGLFWTLRKGVDRSRKDLKVDWENLQRPGYSPDYLGERYDRIDLTAERSDWIPSVAAEALVRNNGPLLAYIGGKAPAFTAKDHNFLPGQTVEKQLIVINNSRETVSCECHWSLGISPALTGAKSVSVPTGQQQRVPLRLDLPAGLTPGTYDLTATVKFSQGEPQKDSFTIHVLPPPPAAKLKVKIALFDPKGETGKLLDRLGVKCQCIEDDGDLAGYDVLIIGKGALTLAGPGPDASSVRDGLKMIVFEQAADVLEKRFGFRVQQYGLRNVFKRVSDHPALSGLDVENLRDWQGEATLLPPRLKYETADNVFAGSPTIKWCDIPVAHVWRCGNRGSVASVLIEKPARGDFLPLVDGGFSLQYSPLMEYHEGTGMVMFCQMDVTGRTETDPAAERLAQNIIGYVSDWKPAANRPALYAGDAAGKAHLKKIGVSVASYEGGKPSPEQVLIVGPGGGQELSTNAAVLREWLKAGGHLLAVGLDQSDIAAVLPDVTTKKAEHIAAYFEPIGAASPLAGVGPADVHNRAPKEFSLVTAGATIVGDGVLAKADNANVVFCQLVPWQLDYSKEQHNVKQTFRHASFVLMRLLGNMGVETLTPLLARFSSPVTAAEGEKRWLDGLYLDQPEEWDDPYRFFRW